jgi:hypothetical protein
MYEIVQLTPGQWCVFDHDAREWIKADWNSRGAAAAWVGVQLKQSQASLQSCDSRSDESTNQAATKILTLAQQQYSPGEA